MKFVSKKTIGKIIFFVFLALIVGGVSFSSVFRSWPKYLTSMILILPKETRLNSYEIFLQIGDVRLTDVGVASDDEKFKNEKINVRSIKSADTNAPEKVILSYWGDNKERNEKNISMVVSHLNSLDIFDEEKKLVLFIKKEQLNEYEGFLNETKRVYTKVTENETSLKSLFGYDFTESIQRMKKYTVLANRTKREIESFEFFSNLTTPYTQKNPLTVKLLILGLSSLIFGIIISYMVFMFSEYFVKTNKKAEPVN